MPPEVNYNALFADFSDTAACLFAIQSLSDSGAFNNYPEIQELLSVFQQNTLVKLYFKAVAILQKIDGIDVPPVLPFGDFWELDFAADDFIEGYFNGDYTFQDFTGDFLLSYLDTTNAGFSSLFQTILNILVELKRKVDQISVPDLTALNYLLVQTLLAINTIKVELSKDGFSPCIPNPSLYLNNSTDVYLQAAGSDGSDGIAAGLHLRWSLAGDIGQNHLPKGDYDTGVSTTVPYNQPDDYIKIYRTPYTAFTVSVDFSEVAPVVDYPSKTWTYFINQTITAKAFNNQLTLTFTDSGLYDQVAVAHNPADQYFSFLQAYTGIVRIAVANKSVFRAALGFVNGSATGAPVIKAEAVCIADAASDGSETVYTRSTTAAAPGANTVDITAENIQAINILASPGVYLKSLVFETYSDFLLSRSDDDWTEIGTGFALSTVDDDVYNRLESEAYPINELWPQYNDGTTVKVANYRDKWGGSHDPSVDPSIKAIVTQYLSLSETDPRALLTLTDLSVDINPATFQLSLVDMLNLAASDYHVARMLGLGWIDATIGAGDTTSYIYKLSYTNRTATSATPSERLYMTLPTRIADNLLPLQPEIRPVEYGLPVVNDTVSTAYNTEGYALYAPVRAINIGRQPFTDEIAGYDFFADLTQVDNTNIFVNSRPVSYGIKYRPAGQSSYTKVPGIPSDPTTGVVYNAYDAAFPDTGIPEIILVPDNEGSLYVHMESNTGVHYYAIYGVNWFSRASAVSSEVATGDTEFPQQNRLQPPSDVAVQYVQDEDPVLLTTTDEQTWLAARETAFPGQDVGFTRIVFNWLDIADITNLPDTTPASLAKAIRPNTVKVWFDPNLPYEVQGMIGDIQPVPGQANQLNIFTAPYTKIDGTTLSPAIDSDNYFRFDNSLFNTPEGQFAVLAITAGTTGPVITINQVIQNSTIEDSTTQGNYGLVQTYQSPKVGSQFSMVENLSNTANWQPVDETVSLITFADADTPRIETDPTTGSNTIKNWVGGINDNNGLITIPVASDGSALLPAGYYQIDFAKDLAPHPQNTLPSDPGNTPGAVHDPFVEWYKGWLRVVAISGDMKQVEVLRIVRTSPIQLIIYDPGYQDDPIPVSSSGTDYISVNFHPGYRAYLLPEPAPGTFNAANIVPAGNQVSRKTMVGLQTADTREGGSGFSSPVSLPAVLLARLIVQPVQLPAPVLASTVVRPNAKNKAALTFDTTVPPGADGSAQSPFGFKFCRLTEEDALYALYEETTVDRTILPALEGLTSDPSYNQRYYELVNVVVDGSGNFNVLPAEPNAYGFPAPDKTGLVQDTDTLEVKLQKYARAIQATVLPLTATVPIFQFFNPGYQTENVQPTIRDANGNLLDPLDPAFNPFPMITKYNKSGVANTTFVRFTDFTLNASSRSLYFYAAAEVTNQLIAGPLSSFAGPVTILNTTPPEPPIIQTFSIQSSAAGVTSPISVLFQVSPMAPYDNITAVRLYRTTELALTNALATMGNPVELPVAADPDQMGYLLTDTFSDMTNIPFGDLLYYRLASVRSIINEFNQPEDVVSVASDLAMINMIDTVNPNAPRITASGNTLSWLTTVNKGTYYLYQQNSKGNWTLLHTDTTAALNVTVSFTVSGMPTQDANGNPVYNRFKVRVQNSSGLFNLTDNILTISPV